MNIAFKSIAAVIVGIAILLGVVTALGIPVGIFVK
tara:strand:- start:238 stop:342 length:105 start_codon:yes stop_codon:yes gene_type:complete